MKNFFSEISALILFIFLSGCSQVSEDDKVIVYTLQHDYSYKDGKTKDLIKALPPREFIILKNVQAIYYADGTLGDDGIMSLFKTGLLSKNCIVIARKIGVAISQLKRWEISTITNLSAPY